LLRKSRDFAPGLGIVCGLVHEHADTPHAIRLLRRRGQQPRGRRTAKKRREEKRREEKRREEKRREEKRREE
jgi:hypothetical protein